MSVFKKKSIPGIIGTFFLAVFLLYLCSLPVFYALTSYDLASETPSSGILHLAMRVLRFFPALAFCFFLRKNNKDLLADCNSRRNWLFPVILIITCYYSWLSLCAKTRLFGNIYHHIIYFLNDEAPLFLNIALDELTRDSMVLTVLYGLLLLFFPGFKRNRSV